MLLCNFMVISTFLEQINYISLLLILIICRTSQLLWHSSQKSAQNSWDGLSHRKEDFVGGRYVGPCYSGHYSDQIWFLLSFCLSLSTGYQFSNSWCPVLYFWTLPTAHNIQLGTCTSSANGSTTSLYCHG